MGQRSEIQEFYSERSVFITGVSGFLGKALLEKLLRSCPNVNKIYVLLREKLESDPETRLKNIWNSPIFDALKKVNPEAIEKVVAIAGDIILPDLGISSIDRETLCKNVSVVIHSAASIKFNEPLKITLNVNYYGTKRMVELCEQMESLAVLVHISTAYSNCDAAEVPEEIVVPNQESMKPKEIQFITDSELETLTPKIIGGKPNTYTYAKFQAEYLLQEHAYKVPIAIVRPSIIVAAWKEPEAGFVDSLTGMTGIFAASAKGMLTSIVSNKSKMIDIIPLDVTVNLILASAWKTASENNSTITVYNCCSGTINPISTGMVRNHIVDTIHQFPSKICVGHPKLRCVTNDTLNTLLNFWTTFLPLFFLDCFAIVSGKKPKMIKQFKNILTATNATKYFRLNEWKFETENTTKLENSMGPLDREIFYWNIRDIDWKEYFTNYCLGIKKWIFMEDITDFTKPSYQDERKINWVDEFSQPIALILFVVFIWILL